MYNRACMLVTVIVFVFNIWNNLFLTLSFSPGTATQHAKKNIGQSTTSTAVRAPVRALPMRCATKKPVRVVVLGPPCTTLDFRMNHRIQSVLLVARGCPTSYCGGAAAAAAALLCIADHAAAHSRPTLMTCKMIQR